jgi:hypothetical protein
MGTEFGVERTSDNGLDIVASLRPYQQEAAFEILMQPRTDMHFVLAATF